MRFKSADEPPEAIAELIAQAIVAEREISGMPAWPAVLAWSRHPEGVLVESNGARWLIGHNDTDGVQRLAKVIEGGAERVARADRVRFSPEKCR